MLRQFVSFEGTWQEFNSFWIASRYFFESFLQFVISQIIDVLVYAGIDPCPPTSEPRSLTNYTGTFTSPNYPSVHYNQALCNWLITSIRPDWVRMRKKSRCYSFVILKSQWLLIKRANFVEHRNNMARKTFSSKKTRASSDERIFKLSRYIISDLKILNIISLSVFLSFCQS
jgi:hypothetical protein